MGSSCFGCGWDLPEEVVEEAGMALLLKTAFVVAFVDLVAYFEFALGLYSSFDNTTILALGATKALIWLTTSHYS